MQGPFFFLLISYFIYLWDGYLFLFTIFQFFLLRKIQFLQCKTAEYMRLNWHIFWLLSHFRYLFGGYCLFTIFFHFRWSIDFFFVMWFEQAKKRFKWTELKIGKLKKLKAKGHTNKEIAKMLGTSHGSVNSKWKNVKVISLHLPCSHQKDYKCNFFRAKKMQ